jgi:hypothetical protein
MQWNEAGISDENKLLFLADADAHMSLLKADNLDTSRLFEPEGKITVRRVHRNGIDTLETVQAIMCEETVEI